MALKVMFIDDEEALCECFVDLFSSADVSIYPFSNVDAAISDVGQINPDLIFIDFRIPGMNGDEVAAKLPSNIPKFLITGELDPQPNYRFDDILPKPFDCARIEAILHSYQT